MLTVLGGKNRVSADERFPATLDFVKIKGTEMALTWKSYGFQSAKLNSAAGKKTDITDALLSECLGIMCSTSQTHLNKDFPNYKTDKKLRDDLIYKINNEMKVEGDKTGFKAQYNWLMVSIGWGAADETDGRVAIIYHLLRHRMKESIVKNGGVIDEKDGLWSVSVGIHKDHVKDPDSSWKVGDPKHMDYEYVKLAQEVESRMKADLVNLTPSGRYFVVMDHYDKDDDSSGVPGSDPKKKRRLTRGGEFGYVVQQLISNKDLDFSVVEGPKKTGLPKDRDGAEIKSWAGSKDPSQIVVTRIKVGK